MREGSLEAPTRHPIAWQEPEFLRPGCHRERDGAGLRHLPRLPPLLQSLRFVSPAVRPGRRLAHQELDGVDRRRLQVGRRRLHAVRHVLHDEVSVRPATRIQPRFPASDAALPRHGGEAGQGQLRRPPTRRDRPQRRSSPGWSRRIANWATRRDNKIVGPIVRKPAGLHPDAELPKYAGQHAGQSGRQTPRR